MRTLRAGRTTLLGLWLFLELSCAPRVAPEDTDWLTPVDTLDRLSRADLRIWSPVSPSRFFWVRDDEVEGATAELEVAAFREIPRARAAELMDPAAGPAEDGLRAFLVRGACVGHRPTFASFFLSTSGVLHVHQGTAHPEMLPFGIYWPPLEKRPMVVFLEGGISDVLVTADYGGDRAMRAFGPTHAKFCDLPPRS